MSEKKITKEIIHRDFKRAYEYKKKFNESAKEDFKFALGRQWKTEDIEYMDSIGVPMLTINKIRPIIRLIKGIESQNRTDFKAFEEGKEDALEAEIVTSLLHNVIKNNEGNYKLSEMFEDGITCGEGWLEPWVDYTDNMLFGKLKLKKVDYDQMYPDPDAKEYDFSDGKFFIKLTWDLSEDQVISLFPEKEDQIKEIGNGKVSLEDEVKGPTVIIKKQVSYTGNANVGDMREYEEKRFDLIEYNYKKYVAAYYVADLKLGTLKKANDKAEADNYVNAANAAEPGTAKVIKRFIPEFWRATIIGDGDILEDEPLWCFPQWKGYPYIPYLGYFTSTPLDEEDRDLAKQGITRQLKDLNVELNKRRSQELRILNSSANGGWLSEENAWVSRDKVEKFGSSPGVLLEYKSGKQKPERITPTPLSQGHAQLAQEGKADINETSGINTDLLAMQEGGQDSGRAIALRQKQGLVMVQDIFDNLSRSKRLLGRFILSQLNNVFDVGNAIRVLGDAFLRENFMVPVVVNGQPQLDMATGQLQMQVDQEMVVNTFNQVLQDENVGNYDIHIGESAQNETIKFANYMVLMDMAKQGIPIPPEILIEESLISSANKQKIVAAIEAQQKAMAQQPQKQGAK